MNPRAAVRPQARPGEETNATGNTQAPGSEPRGPGPALPFLVAGYAGGVHFGQAQGRLERTECGWQPFRSHAGSPFLMVQVSSAPSRSLCPARRLWRHVRRQQSRLERWLSIRTTDSSRGGERVPPYTSEGGHRGCRFRRNGSGVARCLVKGRWARCRWGSVRSAVWVGEPIRSLQQ